MRQRSSQSRILSARISLMPLRSSCNALKILFRSCSAACCFSSNVCCLCCSSFFSARSLLTCPRTCSICSCCSCADSSLMLSLAAASSSVGAFTCGSGLGGNVPCNMRLDSLNTATSWTSSCSYRFIMATSAVSLSTEAAASACPALTPRRASRSSASCARFSATRSWKLRLRRKCFHNSFSSSSSSTASCEIRRSSSEF
mmetsp:Transcript_8420/g.21562  ORF Transcript_8420/g.21562 Transcript_8420/m.21562 type:complete len:200 (-) Transcript_8420:131-730(-)